MQANNPSTSAIVPSAIEALFWGTSYIQAGPEALLRRNERAWPMTGSTSADLHERRPRQASKLTTSIICDQTADHFVT
jgi:hypothetical protein